MQQASLENEGLGVNPVSSPGRGLSGGPTDAPAAELFRVSDMLLLPTSSQGRHWHPCLLTASAQELGAQTAVTPHARRTPGSLRVAKGSLGPQRGPAASSELPSPS